MKRTKKVYYRKKTASLTQKRIKTFKAAYKKHMKSALKRQNLLHHAVRYFIVFLAVLSIFAVAQGILMYSKYQDMKKKRDEIMTTFKYWEEVVREHPNFPDGYYNAAVYAGMLGEKDKAIEYIRQAISLDPEFVEAKELEDKIE